MTNIINTMTGKPNYGNIIDGATRGGNANIVSKYSKTHLEKGAMAPIVVLMIAGVIAAVFSLFNGNKMENDGRGNQGRQGRNNNNGWQGGRRN